MVKVKGMTSNRGRRSDYRGWDTTVEWTRRSWRWSEEAAVTEHIMSKLQTLIPNFNLASVFVSYISVGCILCYAVQREQKVLVQLYQAENRLEVTADVGHNRARLRSIWPRGRKRALRSWGGFVVVIFKNVLCDTTRSSRTDFIFKIWKHQGIFR
jgi:hypothetical protein